MAGTVTLSIAPLAKRSAPAAATARSPASSRTALAVHAAAVALPALGALLTDEPAVPLIVGGVAMILACSFLAAQEASRSPILVTPLSFMFLSNVAALGLAPLHLARQILNEEVISFSRVTLAPDAIAQGYLIFLTGSLALHAGIQVARPRPGKAAAQVVPPGQKALAAALVIWALSFVMRLGWESLNVLGAMRGVFSYGSLAMLSLLALRGSGTKPRTGVFYAALVLGSVAEFVMSVQTGMKGSIMYSFIPIVWFLSTTRKVRWLLIPLGIALVAFYFAILAPVISTARTRSKPVGQSTFSYLMDTYSRGEFVSSDGQLAQYFERAFDPMPVAFIYSEVQEYGFQNGDTLDYLTYAFIPRALWPEKPYVTRGAWFTMYLGAAGSESEATSSTGQTAAGELYWNFGLLGVILGMLGLGLFAGVQWRICGSNPEQDPILFLLYATLTFGIMDMSEAGAALVAGVYRVLMFGMFLGARGVVRQGLAIARSQRRRDVLSRVVVVGKRRR